jgi:MFS family permease
MALLFGAAGLNYADRTAITAVFPLLRADLGMSDVALGATGTVFLWTYAAVSPFAGYFGDQTSRARLLTFSLGAWSLTMAASAFATSTAQLLIMRAILGIAEAAYIPAATALIADHHDSRTRAKAMGLHIAGISLGMIGGGWLAGYLGDRMGWRPAFVVLGACGLALAGACFAFLRDASGSRRTDAQERLSLRQSLERVFRVPTFVVLTTELLLSGCVTWVLINWLPLFFRETYSLSLAMAALYGTLWIQGGRITGLLAGGVPSDWAARRNPRYRMLIMSLCYAAAAPLLISFAVTDSFYVISGSILLFSLLFGAGYVNAQPLLCELLPEHLRSTAIGFMNMMACLVGGGSVLIAGALKSTFGLANSFASLSVILAVIALMLFGAYLTVVPRDLAKAKSSPKEVASVR